MLNNRLLTLLESIRTSFWFIPSTMVCCAALLAHAFLAFDHYGDGSDLEALAFLYQTSAESARSILSTIATSMMTVTIDVAMVLNIEHHCHIDDDGHQYCLFDNGGCPNVGIFTIWPTVNP